MLRAGMVLQEVAGRVVDNMDDAHYFFSAAAFPLTLT